MDRLLYVAMSGAKEMMNRLAVHGNNLANASTTGFQADFEQARSMQAYGEGMPSRVFAMAETPGQNLAAGSFKTTSRDLDIAIKGEGWLAVETADGREAYTRNGNLQLNELGMLQTSSGQPVLGQNGPIFVPLPVDKIEIGEDGTVTVRPQGAPPSVMDTLDRIKLVNVPRSEIMKSTDGLFHPTNGEPFNVDDRVRIASGVLEGSNVNPIDEMTHMISTQRQFEMQIKLMKTAEEMDQASSSLMRLG